MVAREAHARFDAPGITGKGAIFFHANGAAFTLVGSSVAHLQEFVEKCVGHFERTGFGWSSLVVWDCWVLTEFEGDADCEDRG